MDEITDLCQCIGQLLRIFSTGLGQRGPAASPAAYYLGYSFNEITGDVTRGNAGPSAR